MRAALFEHGDESTDPADHWQGGVAIVNCVEDADDHGDDDDGDGDDDSGVDDERAMMVTLMIVASGP